MSKQFLATTGLHHLPKFTSHRKLSKMSFGKMIAFTLLKPKFFRLELFKRYRHLEYSPNARLNKNIYDRYACLPIPDCKCIATYVFIDGTGVHVRAKSRTLDLVPSCPGEAPNWTFDGSSAGFAKPGEPSDTYLHPVAMYKDPILKGKHKLLMCETYTTDSKPTTTNFRKACVEALKCVSDKEPQFGMEQEFHYMDVNNRPFGWPIMRGEPAPAGPYYCGVGATRCFGREILEVFYRCALYCGIDVFGINAEVTPSQMEFSTGPTEGIKAGDDLWMARYLLWRIAEDYGVEISLHPKLFANWNGSGLHTNLSSKEMREDDGIRHIEEAIARLEPAHAEHLKIYDPSGGKENAARLTGDHETSSTTKFTSGVANRMASVRISKEVADKKKGYLEDRRPAANSDPYRIISALVNTIFKSSPPQAAPPGPATK